MKFYFQHAPAFCWTTGEPVPAVVLGYLLYRQAQTKNRGQLEASVAQVLALIDQASAADAACALFQGWLRAGARESEAWSLPLLCTLADDRVIAPLSRRIEGWQRAKKRTLAAQALQALGLIGSQATLAEVKLFAKQFKYGPINRAAKAILAANGMV